MKTILKTLAVALLTFATLGTHSAWAADNGDWIGKGADTKASTTDNWHNGIIPSTSGTTVMRFADDACSKTVTFDRAYETVGLYIGSTVANRYYNPTTGSANPVIWEATDPAYGVTFTGNNGFTAPIGSFSGQNGALTIRSGTYNIKNDKLCLAGNGGGAAWMCIEEGTVSIGNELTMANASGAHARLIVGSGDPTKVAKITVPDLNWVRLCADAGGDGQITLKAGGEFRCSYIASLATDKGILRFDGGTLVKTSNVQDPRPQGFIYGSGDWQHNVNNDNGRVVEVTANGGTINIGAFDTTLGATVRLAEGAEDGVLTKRGSAKLTLLNAASVFGGTFCAAEGTLALGTVGANTKAILDGGTVTLGGGTLAKLTLGGDFNASVANLPAHTALAIKGGATLKIDDLTSSPLANETSATFDADVSAQNPITINLLNPGDNSIAYPIVGGLDLADGEVDFVKLEGLAEGGSCFVEGGKLMLKLADNVVASAVWTNELGDNDPSKPGNWTCYNAAGKVIPDVLPGKTVTLALSTDGTWASWPEFFTADSTIDLMDHNLTVPTLDKGKIIDSSVTEKYELLDYIESTGSQYIDTGYTHVANTKIECVLEAASVQGGWAAVFGARNDTFNNNAYCFFAVSFGDQNMSMFNRSGVETKGGAFPRGEKTTLTCLGQDATWETEGGVTGGIRTTGTANTGVNTMFIFDLNKAKSGGKQNDTSYCRMKLYSFKISEDGVVKRDLVPARRIADCKVGLLDLANRGENEFYADAKGGNFVPGAEKEQLSIGELHVTVASGETIVNSAVTISGGIPLVKDGAGTLTWGGGTLTAATPIIVTDGVFKMGVTTQDVFGNSGTITVKGTGQFDLNCDQPIGVSSPTINRTFYIEGEGPDGSGAIVNNATGTNAGQHLKTVNLTGDATIGGSHSVEFRATVGTCLLSGEGQVLTIKASSLLFNQGNSGCKVDRIVVDGGWFKPCADSTGKLDVKECIELKNGGKLIPWNPNGTATYSITIPVVVSAGDCTVGATQGSTSLKDVEVKSGATLSVEKSSASITGTLSGSGAITGSNLSFSGANACWHIDISGKTVQKVNLENAPVNFLAGMKKVEVLSSKGRGYYDLAPLKGLSSFDGVTLTVTDVDTGKPLKLSKLQIKDERLGVLIPCGMIIFFN